MYSALRENRKEHGFREAGFGIICALAQGRVAGASCHVYHPESMLAMDDH